MTKMLKSLISVFLAVFMVVSLAAVPSSAISLSSSSITLTKGYQTTLSVSGTSKTVTWSTGDKSIATVSSKGKVVGKAPGSTYVYAKVGGNTLKCKVTVVAAKITASSSNVTFSKKGETKTITITVKGSHSGLTVGTTNKSVASASWVKPVEWDGDKIKIKVTAQGTGTATIKVYLKNYKSTCYKNISVNVGNTTADEDPDSSTGGSKLSILPYSNSIDLSANESYLLQVYSTNQSRLAYTVGDTSIISVSAGKVNDSMRGFTITGVNAGSTTIRFYDKNNTKTYYDVKVTVTANKYYELYTTPIAKKQNSTDEVIKIQINTNTIYYMLAPAGYDPAYVNSIIGRQLNKYQYYNVYTEIPSRMSSDDTYYSFYHTNRSYNYGTRYVLLPKNYDQVMLDTALAKYNGSYEYWTVYSERPTVHDSWDVVETWMVTNSKGETMNRYILIPYSSYDYDRLTKIRDEDIASHSSYTYYTGYDKWPTVTGTKDKIQMYVKGGKYRYMVVPADDSGIAQANDAIAKDTGMFEYNVIYSLLPTGTGDDHVEVVGYGGSKYYVLLKKDVQTPDSGSIFAKYANGVKDD